MAEDAAVTAVAPEAPAPDVPVAAASPAEELAPVTAPDGSAENEGGDASASTEPADAPADPFGDLDEDAIRNHPRIAGMLQAEMERERQRASREVEDYHRKQLGEWIERGGHIQQTVDLVSNAVDKGQDIDKASLAELFAAFGGVEHQRAAFSIHALALADLEKGTKIPGTLARAMNEAWDSVRRGQPNALEAAVKADIEVLKEVALEQERQKLRAEVEKELRKEHETKLQARLEEEKAKLPAPSGPTTISGDSSGTSINSMADADRAYISGAITHEQYKGFRQKHNVA